LQAVCHDESYCTDVNPPTVPYTW